jgi:hypothetical protein
MTDEKANWFSFSSANRLALACANCRNDIDLQAPFLDHHASVCPKCDIECAFLDWKDRKIQIVLQNSPPVLANMIRYLQINFDELEYVELIACLDEMADAIR